jgi:hypothetical protein
MVRVAGAMVVSERGAILVGAATARFLAELAVAARLGVHDPGRGVAHAPNPVAPGVVCARR